MNIDNSFKIQTVKHTFITKFAYSNSNGRFTFEFREPIRNVVGAKVRSVYICNFSTINNSQTYYLRVDCIFGSRDTSYINTKPDLVAMVIPNAPQIAGQPIFSRDASDGYIHCFERYLHNCWFELLDDTLTTINPLDNGWYFTVELEFLIKIKC
jgi:hypothetical protein